MTNFTIVSPSVIDEKLLKALLMLLSLKGIAKGFLIGSILTLCLFLYTMIASALCELTSNISVLWQSSDSITRLLLLCLAVYVIKKAFPYILLLHKKGVI